MKWISVKDKLPKIYEPVLIYEKYQENPCSAFLNGSNQFIVCNNYGNVMYDSFHDVEYVEVSH